MAIETRHSNRRYFYRKRRIGNRVVSEYVGGSEFDFMLQKMEQVERYKAKHKRNLAEAEKMEFAKVDSLLNKLETAIDSLVKAYLVSRGFSQTSSREWRYKDEEKSDR